MQHDRVITISTAGSRKAQHWTTQTLLWSELVARLHTPARGQETLEEYMRWPKSKQDDAKDVGGYVAGELADGRRKSGCVLGRDVVTLDLDNIQPGGTDDVLRLVDSLSCGYAVYSTRKHSPAKPRLRVLIPLARTCTADEYEPVARRMAELLDLALCDPSTFEATRLMYWPSCSSDSQYVYTYSDAPMLDVDGVLATYHDWRDMTTWPQVPGAPERQAKLAERQADPTTKPGIVGAFCRVYDVPKALEDLIPGVYTPCDTPGRWTYTGGSTTGGAVVYDNGLYLYSHHATDPAGGKLCNAFDLVRVHKFADLDDDAKPGTPPNKLPSYQAMCRLATADPQVAYTANAERYQAAAEDFSPAAADDDASWMLQLKLNANTGRPDKVASNVSLMLDQDPRLRGRLRRDSFADRVVGTAPLPWGIREQQEGQFEWTDADSAGLRIYVETVLGFRSRDLVDDAYQVHTQRLSYNPVQDYLAGLQWDGVPRLDTIYVDYLGAEDTPYTRAVARKGWAAAVARAMQPGIKYDTMTVLTGPQGIGKSTLLAKMGGAWFTDAIKTFEGKEASELVQGKWIIEIGELEALNKSEDSRCKQFISLLVDYYRAAYGRLPESHPRRCVFFGTTNNAEYLRDRTGNRRYWPVDVGVCGHKKDVFRDLDGERDQIWAEAYIAWQLGESLYMSGDLGALALDAQEIHRERSPREGLIQDFVNKEVPEDWAKWSRAQRSMYWGGGDHGNIPTVPRDRVCALEVWVEALGGDYKGMRYADAKEINAIIAKMDGWESHKSAVRCGPYGVQKGFARG